MNSKKIELLAALALDIHEELVTTTERQRALADDLDRVASEFGDVVVTPDFEDPKRNAIEAWRELAADIRARHNWQRPIGVAK
jgi:hypothetical protein